MKKNKNFEILVIIGLVILTLLLIGIYKIIEINKKRNIYTMIFSPYSILECSKWECLDKSNDLNLYNNKNYNIFINGKYYGKQKLFYNDRNSKFYVFDEENKNIYNSDDNLFTYDGSISIIQYNYTINDLKDYNVLNELINTTDLEINLNQVKYVSYDFDNDNNNENLYLINSGFSEAPYFNALVYNNNGNYKLIVKEEVEDSLKNSTLNFTNLIDIYDDNKLEFIISKIYYDQIGTCNQLYRLKGNKYIPLNECEIVK